MLVKMFKNIAIFQNCSLKFAPKIYFVKVALEIQVRRGQKCLKNV